MAALMALAACRSESTPKVTRPALQVIEEADRRSSTERVPARSTVFDGETVRLQAARGETIGITVWQAAKAPTRLLFSTPDIAVRGYEVQWHSVRRPSTTMYGGSRGAGAYPDGLIEAAAPASDPAYFDIAIASGAEETMWRGQLEVGEQRFPVELLIRDVGLPPLGERPWVWGYYDPRELAWRRGVAVNSEEARAEEAQCAAMFRAHGVMATPELAIEDWPARRAQVAGSRYVPVLLPSDAAEMQKAAAFWNEALAATDQYGFAIPIDEPRSEERRREVRALGERLRQVRGVEGPPRLLLAVTDEPRDLYGDAVDVFISPYAISREASARSKKLAPRALRWTYNGNPPYAGSMVLDAGASDLRTWGWIGWRWQVPLWYAWDVLYWHDRHNAVRAKLPRPGRGLSIDDAVTFDDGEDHGNFDGVLALPGDVKDAKAPPCLPTLRLKQLRRGLQDRQLLEAASCTPELARVAAEIAASQIPFALGDAFAASWKRPVAWSAARSQLLDLASECQRAKKAN